MRINGTSAFSTIKLGEGSQIVPREVQVLRTGKFNHPKYGAFEITPLILAELKASFDSKIYGVDSAIDYFHESDKVAAGWFTELTLKEDGTELWGTVDWTPTAAKKLSDRELRYFSPDFAFKWTDPEKNVTFSNVLFGGGLTNRPFVKEMKAIVADESQGENMTDLEKAQAQVKQLSEDKAACEKKMLAMAPHDPKAADPAAPVVPAPPAAPKKLDDPSVVEGLQKQIADLQAQLQKAQGEADVALAEKKKADEAKMLAEKTSSFNLLLSEGKACAAQKDAFLKGDMTEFVKLAQPLNLKGSGVADERMTMAEADSSQILKLADEKQKADPKLDRGSAVSLAKKELKK